MWDNAVVRSGKLSHDLPCVYCGHAPHHYLPCDHGCDCAGASDALAPGNPTATR
jgi:hypothetical protein